MWKTGCCICPALILAIIGVAVDVLMWQHANVTEYVDITVTWGYNDAYLFINVDDSRELDKTINYQDSYDTFCDNVTTQPSYCKDLKDVIHAGKVYVAFNSIGISLLTIAIVLSLTIVIGKSCCNCKCRLKSVIAILVLLATICFGIAAGVFLNDFSPNLNNLLNDIIYDIYPILSYIDWEEVTVGASLILIFCAMSASFLALGVIIAVDRKYGENANVNPSVQNRLIADNHNYPGAAPLKNAYGSSNGNVIQTNDGNNNRVGEPDYIYTQPNMPQYSNTTIYVPMPNNNEISRQV